jgi:head-tail adaptor
MYFGDRILLQQVTMTDDGAGGNTATWDGVLSLKCRVIQLSGREVVDTYQREANEEVYRVMVEDRIPYTDSETSLHRLLRKAGEERFRFVWQGDRTITPIGMQRPGEGMSHNIVLDLLWIDCVETPEGRGYQDL